MFLMLWGFAFCSCRCCCCYMTIVAVCAAAADKLQYVHKILIILYGQNGRNKVQCNDKFEIIWKKRRKREFCMFE
jgi:hypothetical protein